MWSECTKALNLILFVLCINSISKTEKEKQYCKPPYCCLCYAAVIHFSCYSGTFIILGHADHKENQWHVMIPHYWLDFFWWVETFFWSIMYDNFWFQYYDYIHSPNISNLFYHLRGTEHWSRHWWYIEGKDRYLLLWRSYFIIYEPLR